MGIKSTLVPAGMGQEAGISAALSLLAIIIFFLCCGIEFNRRRVNPQNIATNRHTHTQIETTAQRLFLYFHLYFIFFCEGVMRQRKTVERMGRKNKPAPAE